VRLLDAILRVWNFIYLPFAHNSSDAATFSRFGVKKKQFVLSLDDIYQTKNHK